MNENEAKRLHIAHFTNTYLPVMNGVVRSVTSFRQAQIDLGHNVFIFTHDTPGYEDEQPFIFRYPALNIPVRNYPVTIPVSPRIDWVLPILKPHVIHAHHPAPIGSAASDKAQKLNAPLVFTHHTRYQEYSQLFVGEGLGREVMERLIADYLHQCQRVIAPSSSIKRMIEQTYGIQKGVEVVPTGLDLAPYEEADGAAIRRKQGWDEDEKIIISVGRLVQEKNVRTLMKAAVIVLKNHPDARLALIGDGPLQKELTKIGREAGVAEQVTFVGRVPFQEIPAYLKAADVFCFASITETQGLVTMEAMAAGLPVAAVDASGTSDIVQDGKNGLLTENDSEALATAVERILDDPDLAQTLREGALERAKAYEIHHTTARLIEVYQEAIIDHRRGFHLQPDKRKPIFQMAWERLVERTA